MDTLCRGIIIIIVVWRLLVFCRKTTFDLLIPVLYVGESGFGLQTVEIDGCWDLCSRLPFGVPRSGSSFHAARDHVALCFVVDGEGIPLRYTKKTGCAARTALTSSSNLSVCSSRRGFGNIPCDPGGLLKLNLPNRNPRWQRRRTRSRIYSSLRRDSARQTPATTECSPITEKDP